MPQTTSTQSIPLDQLAVTFEKRDLEGECETAGHLHAKRDMSRLNRDSSHAPMHVLVMFSLQIHLIQKEYFLKITITIRHI